MGAIRSSMLASGLVFFLSFAMLAPAVGATTASSQFAAYRISGNFGNHSISAVVNETVAPSSSAGMSDLGLKVVSGMANFSYSEIMNSSKVIFPYFPTIANQSFSYQVHNYSISASIAQIGSVSAGFNGKSYTLTNYTFSVSGAKLEGSAMNATGGASVFPSGLVYSAWVTANSSDTFHIQLVGTNLSLDVSSGNSQTTSIAVAGGAGSILAGVGAFVFYRRKNNSVKTDNANKPLYHVD